MQSVIETLEGAVPSMLSRCSMRWVPPEEIEPAPPPLFPAGLTESMRQLGEALTRFFAVVEPPRDPRISAMRRAYRQKRGRGW